jgi:hypothetical protein
MYTYPRWHQAKYLELEDLKGLVIKSVEGLEEESEEVIFSTECGKQFKMYHEQDCCEGVAVDDVCGGIDDLIGAEIVHFEERTNHGDEDSDPKDKPSEYCESFTWTFYDIQTTKGSVNIKWLGESNGYYSESVDIVWGVPCQ